MAKLINERDLIIKQVISGICKTQQNVMTIGQSDIVVRKELTPGKVGIVSGGGSGHEPAHAGYVGLGMLDAAVCGPIFTSPTPDKVLEAIKAVDQGAGVLLIVKNYTGDVMNFEMASEMAELSGINCEMVIVGDDVAVENSTYTAGRRGIAGTIYVHKIIGQLAEQGMGLEQLAKAANSLATRIKSMGMSASSCVNPQVGTPMFEMAYDQVEIGMGIHGEPGIRREQLKPVREIVHSLLDTICLECSTDKQYLVLVNGLNSTTLMELYIIANDVSDYLTKHGYKYLDIKVGDYMTSLNMDGFSLTLVAVTDDEYDAYLADTEASGW